MATEKTDKKNENSEETEATWRRVQLARHPERPQSLDYIQRLIRDFQELHGDRCFGNDPAIVSGIGFLDEHPVAIIGHQKGRTMKQRLHRNFGMSNPEGYRKALRVMRMAEKYGRPIITLLDTMGAYPGIDAEERGQAEAIAYNLREMARLSVPLIAVVIGEGGSGGALGIGVGNKVFMLENSIYSVISPESCAAIIWRDSGMAKSAAAALRLTADNLLRLGLVDQIIAEPPGGAQTDHDQAAALLREALLKALNDFSGVPASQIIDQRYDRFRQMGNFFTEAPL